MIVQLGQLRSAHVISANPMRKLTSRKRRPKKTESRADSEYFRELILENIPIVVVLAIALLLGMLALLVAFVG
jgi:hypothetical protein